MNLLLSNFFLGAWLFLHLSTPFFSYNHILYLFRSHPPICGGHRNSNHDRWETLCGVDGIPGPCPSGFEDLRNGRDFTDITLACEDQSIKAHKVALSACSPFFKKLLKADPHPQFPNLSSIWEIWQEATWMLSLTFFLSFGEANVFQQELHDFLPLAEEL